MHDGSVIVRNAAFQINVAASLRNSVLTPSIIPDVVPDNVQEVIAVGSSQIRKEKRKGLALPGAKFDQQRLLQEVSSLVLGRISTYPYFRAPSTADHLTLL